MADAQPDLSAAAERLEKALTSLEARLRLLKDKGAHGEGPLFANGDGGDSAREKALETAASEASAALGRAAEEMRAILNGEG
jgi:hypothetical protein